MCKWRQSECPVWSGCVGLWEQMELAELSWDTQLWEWGKARGQAAKPGEEASLAFWLGEASFLELL